MSGPAPWEDVLREHFPAYLLPGGVLRPLPRDSAALLLSRLAGRADLLDLLLAASALAPIAGTVRELARELPELSRALPSQTDRERREDDGRVVGSVGSAGTNCQTGDIVA